jgi:hypothetical protein
VPSEEPEGEEKGRVVRFLEAAAQELPSAMLENVKGYSDLASKYLTWKFGGMPIEDQMNFARSLPSALREAAVNAIQSAKELPEKIRTATPESAGEFTGRVLAGELTDPMRVGRAARAVTNPVMSKIFIGKSAKTWNADAAKRAEEMEKEGYPAELIWEETGTFRSPDGELRQEISDLPSSWKGGESGSSLKDVLEHPELFKAYPDLKETMVKMKSTQEGTYYPALEVAKRPERIEVGEPNSRSIALHEIQHAIQEREDFATGGKPYLLSESDDLLKSYNFFKEFGDKIEEFRNLKRMLPREQRPRVRATINWNYRDFDIDDMLDEIDKKVIDPEIKEKMLNIANELDVKREKVFGPETFGKPVAVEKFENYKKLAGEAEARAVQERAGYSPSMLKETMPLFSYDIPLRELVIKRKQDQ